MVGISMGYYHHSMNDDGFIVYNSALIEICM